MSIVTYSAEEVANGLGCTVRWLVEQARNGKVPASRVSKQWRFTQQDLADILDLFANGFHRLESEPTARLAGLTVQSRRRLVRSDRQQHS
jgi:excisionase family DNA binding protein